MTDKDKTDTGEGKTSPLDKMCIDGHRCIDCNDCPEKKEAKKNE